MSYKNIIKESFGISNSNIIKLNINKLDWYITVASVVNYPKRTYLGGLFYNRHHLVELDLSCFNTSGAYNMQGMFFGCDGLIKLDLSNFDTSSVRSMKELFACRNLRKLDLSSFDTGKVTDTRDMFIGCQNLVELKTTDLRILKKYKNRV